MCCMLHSYYRFLLLPNNRLDFELVTYKGLETFFYCMSKTCFRLFSFVFTA